MFDSADVVLSLKEQPLSLVVALERAGLLPDRPSVACLHRSDPTHSGPALGWLRATGASGAITATISCAESTSLAYAHAGVSTTHAWVIDNGIDARRFRPGTRAERRRIRAGLGIPDDAPVVLMAARFDAMKDPGLFLDAVRRHARRRPGTHYVMCGSGMTTSNPSFAALLDASDVPAGTALHALGLREDMPQLYRIADVVALTRLDAAGTDRAEVIAFLTSNTFPFHVRPRPTRAQIDEAINRGRWGGGDIETFWIDDEGRRIGVVRLDDLSDSTAVVDLRLSERWRGKGLATAALNAAVAHTFTSHPGVTRIEGQTREDNIAMRRTFARCGWVHEAHYRDGWPVEGAEPLAALAYSVLRRDRSGGTTTPLPREPATFASVTRGDVATLISAAWAAEEQLLQPSVRARPAVVRSLLDGDFVEVGQSGRRWTRDEIVAALAADPGGPEAEVDERESRVVDAQTVLLTYRVRVADRVSRRSALWRCDPLPRCLFHQGTAVA